MKSKLYKETYTSGDTLFYKVHFLYFNFTTMIILNQTELNSIESPIGVYNIEEDYTLNGGTLPIPNGKTLKFIGGTINNGTLQFNNNLLQDLTDGSINARITGTVHNTTLYTKQISGINNLGLSNYSGKTIFCDQDENNVSLGIIISNANIDNETDETIFDGGNHSFTCSTTFFSIRNGSRRVTIKRFNAIAVATATEIDFLEMPSSVGVSNIKVLGNHIDSFKIGVSINGEASVSCHVDNCVVSNNTILNARGTTPNHGYGIHLANAHNCTISGNWISNCDRHSIYHAFGDNNTISGNHIVNHRSNYPIGECGVSYSAIDVERRSTNLTISGNSIVNCYSIGIILASHSPYRETPAPSVIYPEKYGVMDNIHIYNNSFVSTNNTDSTNGLPSIMVGTELPGSITSDDLNTYYVNKVEIMNNMFARSYTEQMKCIRVVHCRDTKISGNTFQFNALTTGHTRELVEFYSQFANLTPMVSKVSENTFTASNNISNYSVYCVSFQEGVNNSSFNIEVSGNTLTNQYSGNIQNYKLYKPVGISSIAGTNLTLQTET